MLSKAGGGTFQRVVAKVADLPSPLDARPDETIIVRETEDVYRFDSATHTWQLIGTLKKVGGKKPAEITEHLDSKANPHEVSLAAAYAHGGTIELTEEVGELILENKSAALKALLRLLPRAGSALRIGADVGTSTASIWVNGGIAGQKTPVLRIVDSLGADQFVLDSDGNITSAGVVSFRGGVKGQTTFQDAIIANGGVVCDGTLKLGGKKIALVGGKTVVLSERGLGIGVEPTEALDVGGNLKVGGTVASDLSPSDTLTFSLGDAKRRWSTVFAGGLNIQANVSGDAALWIKPAPGQLAALMEIGGGLVVTASGLVGMFKGAEIQGGVAFGAPEGARFRLTDEPGMRLVFNVANDGGAEDEKQSGWSTSFGGGPRDAFEVLRRTGSGGWKALLRLVERGASVGGDLSVEGGLRALNAQVHQLINPTGNASLSLDPAGRRITYATTGGTDHGAAHEFRGLWKNGTKDLIGLLVDIKDEASGDNSSVLRLAVDGQSVLDVTKQGNVLPGFLEQTLGAAEAPWLWAYLTRGVVVSKTAYGDGLVESAGGFVIRAAGPVAINQPLAFLGKHCAIHTGDSQQLLVAGADGRSIVLDVRPDSYGLSFNKGGAKLTGIGSLELQSLSVTSAWGKGEGNSFTVAVTDEGASPASTLAYFSHNGDEVLALYRNELMVNVPTNLNGLLHDCVEAVVELDGKAVVETPFVIPAGVRVEAVVVKVVGDIKGARFFHVGDASTPDRFATASTKTARGSVVKGLNHCDRGQSVQSTEAPVVLTFDAPATGKVLVQVHYLSPTA